MCGILGVGGGDGRDVVERLLPFLAHRGPDDDGTWCCDQIALGHRRLTIIGLEPEGRQPRVSRSGDSVLVFNGEIYNYLELADELEAAGREVDRRFDTAVLLEGLETWGTDLLSRLNGMFAFAWYRRRERRVILARDRWGKKPLFWGRVPIADGAPTLIFASELRAFTRLPGGPPPPDPLGIARYLTYGGIPQGRTVYRGVEKLPPATWVALSPDGLELDRAVYWRFRREPSPVSKDEAVDRFEDLLLRSVSLRLRSDVPVGLFLSGGIDSSLLAWAWRRLRPDDTIRTFTVGFEDRSYDEREPARLMAETIGSRHHEILVRERELEEEVGRVWEHLSEPFADPSILPTSILCRIARSEVRVALGGDGGDEHQAGYAPFRAWGPAKFLERVVGGRRARRLVSRVEGFLPIDDGDLSHRFKAHHFARGLGHPPEERVQRWLAPYPPELALSVMDPDLAREVEVEEILEPTRRAFRDQIEHGELSAQIGVWVATYLETSILTKIDRASMMHSLEVRAPLLDPEVARFLAGLPDRLVARRGRGKVLLRSVVEKRLPSAIAGRAKKGFGIPQGRWLRTILRPRMEASLDRARAGGDWYRAEAIEQLWEEHVEGRGEYRQELWAFLFSYPFRDT